MKISTSTYIPVPIEAAVREDALLASSWPRRGSDVKLAWPSERFDRLLSIAEAHRVGIRVACRFEVTQEEESLVPLWEMHLDSYCTTNDKDERWRKRVWDDLPFVKGTRSVRRFESYQISRLPADRRSIVGPGGVFFFPLPLIDALRESSLDDGAEWAVITNIGRTETWPQHKLLVTKNVLGPVVQTESMQWRIGDDAYEFLAPRAWYLAVDRSVLEFSTHFNMTSEPTAGYNLSSVVVSPQVKNLLQQTPRSGVFFTPVLDAESELFNAFSRGWEGLEKQVSSYASVQLR